MGVAMGAEIETFLYLSGMGDLLATSLSEHSHNRQMGVLLGQGLSRAEIRAQMGVLPEGYNTVKVMLYVAEKLQKTTLVQYERMVNPSSRTLSIHEQ